MIRPPLLILISLCSALWGQQPVIFTIAGGEPPITPAPGAAVSIGDPPRTAVDSAGNAYFGSNHAIFKIDRTGSLTRVAGTGKNGIAGDGGPALNAQLSMPLGI